jgi:hypothetical protein
MHLLQLDEVGELSDVHNTYIFHHVVSKEACRNWEVALHVRQKLGQFLDQFLDHDYVGGGDGCDGCDDGDVGHEFRSRRCQFCMFIGTYSLPCDFQDSACYYCRDPQMYHDWQMYRETWYRDFLLLRRRWCHDDQPWLQRDCAGGVQNNWMTSV